MPSIPTSIVAATVSCLLWVPVPPVTARQEDAAAAIYAAALDTLFAASTVHGIRTLVLDDSTRRYTRANHVQFFWDDLHESVGSDSSIVRDFERATRTPHSLARIEAPLRRRLSFPLRLAGRRDFLAVRRVSDSLKRAIPGYPGGADGYWQAYYRLFPQTLGATSVSAIGYDRHRTRALVYVTHGCGALCGEDNIVVLRRITGRWIVEKVVTTAVS